jgi:hypothetical protein
VIRIRYGDLPPGLHGKAERRPHGVTVCLLPGLTGSQRMAALRRLRQEASRGCGPALPAPQLAIALGWDRVRTVLRNAAAIVRLHPAASLLHAAGAGALMALFVMVSVSVPGAQEAGQADAGGTAGSGSPAPAATPGAAGAAQQAAGRQEAFWSPAVTSSPGPAGRRPGTHVRARVSAGVPPAP